jgi:hypothetical protein
MAARTAVVAGTATAVHGRVQRRQAERWAADVLGGAARDIAVNVISARPGRID